MTAALCLVETTRSADACWNGLRLTVQARLRELCVIEQRYAILRFHATRAGGQGFVTEPDMTGDLAGSHQFEMRALGLSATGASKSELVTNFMRVLSNATKSP
ncbi:MAG: hypothetical protein AAGI09_11995 [Pseudomonadota bacterium]